MATRYRHIRADVGSIQDVKVLKFVQYRKSEDETPLYKGAALTTVDEVTRHMMLFVSNNGLSKDALSQYLSHEKSLLPQPNNLPKNYREAKLILKDYLIPVRRIDACPNDCMLYRNELSDLTACHICETPRFKSLKVPRKSFPYMEIGPRLARWFGTDNLAKLVQGGALELSDYCDFQDGHVYRSLFGENQMFPQNGEGAVPLGLFLDGQNPNRNLANQKSMWPLLLVWFRLPSSIRTCLGPMMLYGIIPGTGSHEPKNLDTYLDVLIDECLELTECKMIDAYQSAPITVRVRLMHYLCDFPAFAKTFGLAGQAAIRACAYCKETGVYNKYLHKTVHATNRQMLEVDDVLRGTETRQKPKAYTREEEKLFRDQYDKCETESGKKSLLKSTGLKGHYALERLPYHDRLNQTDPDSAHTLTNVIKDIFDLVCGRLNSSKLLKAEHAEGRFLDISAPCPSPSSSDTVSNVSKRKRPADLRNTSMKRLKTGTGARLKKTQKIAPKVATSQPPTPWTLSKPALKKCDIRATTIRVPPHSYDLRPGQLLTKPWLVHTMNAKLKIVTQNVFAWCIRGELGEKQEKTLLEFFEVIRTMCQPSFSDTEITQLGIDTQRVLALMERDFPLHLQDITMHLMHHIPEGIRKYGVLNLRWTFPYERTLCWISRQALNKRHQEVTIMETYSMYDFCAHVVQSGEKDHLLPEKTSNSQLLHRLSNKRNDDTTKDVNEVKVLLRKEHRMEMATYYGKMGNGEAVTVAEVNPLGYATTYYESIPDKHGKHVYDLRPVKDQDIFTDGVFVASVRSTYRKCHLNNAKDVSDILFGKITRCIRHVFRGNSYQWFLLDVCADIKFENGFWSGEKDVCSGESVMRAFEQISDPLYTGEEDKRLYFLNARITVK